MSHIRIELHGHHQAGHAHQRRCHVAEQLAALHIEYHEICLRCSCAENENARLRAELAEANAKLSSAQAAAVRLAHNIAGGGHHG